MRPSISSVARSQALYRGSRARSPFVCRQCLRSASRSSLCNQQQRHASSKDKPKEKVKLTERFRRKLWGTDNPPGQKDPYTKATPEEMAELEEQERLLQEEEWRAAERKSTKSEPGRTELQIEAQRKMQGGFLSGNEANEVEIDHPADAERETLEKLGYNQPVGTPQGTLNANELQGKKLIYAPTGDELDASGYQPADTWDGLARIGGKETKAHRHAWEAENPFHPFIPSKEAPEHLRESLVRKALVEVLTLKDAGLPLNQASLAPQHTTCDYDQVEIIPREDGYSLRYAAEGLRWEILESMTENAGQDQSQIEQHPDKYTDASSSHVVATQAPAEKPSWHEVRIDDNMALKFALTRRIMQLSGRRIGDPVIASFTTVGDIVTHLTARPEPTKLYDVLMANTELQALPNVQVRPNRNTPISKDMEFGRHKVIMAELARRGLRPGGKDLKVEVNIIDD